ncbi:MAG: tyrosine-type recombinase/integrase [Ilumatobacteraceae bacterium]
MTLDEARAVMAAAVAIDPAAALMLRNRRRLRRPARRAGRAAVDRPEGRDAHDRFGDRGHQPGERRWKRARTTAGVDAAWRLHDLRHRSATAAIGQGHDVRTVAGRLGHANPAMTLRVDAHAFAAADQAAGRRCGQTAALVRPPWAARPYTTRIPIIT